MHKSSREPLENEAADAAALQDPAASSGLSTSFSGRLFPLILQGKYPPAPTRLQMKQKRAWGSAVAVAFLSGFIPVCWDVPLFVYRALMETTAPL